MMKTGAMLEFVMEHPVIQLTGGLIGGMPLMIVIKGIMKT